MKTRTKAGEVFRTTRRAIIVNGVEGLGTEVFVLHGMVNITMW